jgi:alkylhydroperoxidase/carboxymuconolactone decarboxylase family protein YurZ
MITMGKAVNEIRESKGFAPRSVVYAEQLDENFGEGIAAFYKAVWKDRAEGLSKKQKHLIVFSIACSSGNTQSAVKILEKLHNLGATRAEITDAMMLAAWTGGIQHFTDFSGALLKEMERLGY